MLQLGSAPLAFIFAVVAAMVEPRVADAQAARVGRLPVLELPAPGLGTCRNDPGTPALRRQGIARMVTFQFSDSSRHRLISLGMSGSGGAVMLTAMMGTEDGRRGESEMVNAFFGSDGAIVHGSRSAFTSGTPTRLSDDRRLGLLPGDTLAVRRLTSALRKRCHA